MNKFAQMSTQQFCNYVSCNPGGAEKAYKLRSKDNPNCDTFIVKEVEVPVIEYRYKEVVKTIPLIRSEVVYVQPTRWIPIAFEIIQNMFRTWIPSSQPTIDDLI